MVKSSDFSRACRLCAKIYRVEKLVKIFSSRGASLNLKESCNAYLPINVAEGDKTMPENVCINCIRRLNAANEFFGAVIAADKFFKRILRKKHEQNSTANTNGELKDEASPAEAFAKSSRGVNLMESSLKAETSAENSSPRNSLDQGSAKYVNIVPKASHVVLGSRNVGEIVISVSSDATSPRDRLRAAMEVLRCPDCGETAKIYSVEERQLFFEYLKQHSCRKNESDDTAKPFSEYKERHGPRNAATRQQGREIGPENRNGSKSNATQGRIWPDGDLPADPGPDPALCENIFEDEVRLDDDFHWPMPKRIRRLHRCPACDFVTKSALRLKSHQKLHRAADKRQVQLQTTSCKHCQKRFETVNEAKKHERLEHVTLGGKNSLCEYCGVMRPQKTLRDHVLKQHTVQSEIEMQECDVCGKSFISPTSLYLHKKIHTIEKQHLCDLCGKAFKQRIAMRRHYMLHFPRAPPKFKCNICEKRVTTRGSLRLHMMRHTGEKPQECPECHMVMRHGLKHHMRLHSDESPFKCVVCGADFKRRDYVRRHMRKHLNETEPRSLECKICDHVFDDVRNFLIHHQNIHCNEIFTQIKIFQCKNCAMQFADALQHRDHEENCTGRTESELSGKTQSYTTLNHPKPSCIEEHKDCPRKITSDRSFPCAYCDYGKETSAEYQSEAAKEPQSRFKFNEEFRRLRNEHEHMNSGHGILADDVMSLGTESSEYSYINIIDKPSLVEKDILMSVDEQIMTSSSVHVFESTVEQFGQTQIGMHLHGEQYTRESLSWKEL